MGMDEKDDILLMLNRIAPDPDHKDEANAYIQNPPLTVRGNGKTEKEALSKLHSSFFRFAVFPIYSICALHINARMLVASHATKA